VKIHKKIEKLKNKEMENSASRQEEEAGTSLDNLIFL